MPAERGADYYSASELGQCARACVASRLGYNKLPLPPKYEGEGGYFERGRELEVECVEVLRKGGSKVWGEQQEVVLHLPDTRTIVTGHIDGFIHDIRYAPSDCVLEVKSPKSWEKFQEECFIKPRDVRFSDPLMARYAWQASVYMHAENAPLFYCTMLHGQPVWFTIKEPPFTLDQIAERVQALDGWVDLNQLPPCSQKDYPCAFAYLHEKEPIKDDPEVDEILKNYAIARATNEATEMVMKTERAKLEFIMESRSVDSIKSNEGTVSRVTTHRQNIDMKGLRRDHPHIAEEYTTRTESTHTRITLPKDEEPNDVRP